MTLVVADSSPISYLALIDALHILPRLYTKVILPHAVLQELRHPHAPTLVQRWVAELPEWVEVREGKLLPLETMLGPGEAEAIALACELHAMVLLDERAGRSEAKRLGLQVAGTVGVLEKAAAERLLDLEDAFRRLQSTNFRIDPSYVRQALARDAARRNRPLSP